MSRVRIINLPKSVDEQQLRDHLAPHLPHGQRDITDLSIIRNAAGAVRMAFVGFPTSAIGQQVVAKADGTYFGAMPIKISTALGLKESQEQKDKVAKEKAEKLEQRRAEKNPLLPARRGRDDDDVDGGTGDANANQQDTQKAAKKTASGAVGSSAQNAGGDNNNNNNNNLTDEDRVNERLLQQQQSGMPSWGAELLLPPPTATSSSAPGGGDKKQQKAEKNKQQQQQEKEANDDNDGEDEGDDDDDEVMEDGAAGSGDNKKSGGKLTKAAKRREKEKEKKRLKKLEEEEEQKQQQQFQQAAGAAVVDVSSDDAFLRSMITAGGGTGGNKNDFDDDNNNNNYEDANNNNNNSTNKIQSTEDALLASSSRVHVTNLPYVATVRELKNFFSSKCGGEVADVHIPVTKDTKQSKGVGYVKFATVSAADRAVDDLNGAVFMGRVIRVQKCLEDPYKNKQFLEQQQQQQNDGELQQNDDGSANFRQMRDAKRKKADDLGLSWNTTYIGNSQAVAIAAKKLNVESSDILNTSHQGAAVRAAVAEAHVTGDAKKVLGAEGINFDMLSGDRALHMNRSDTTILVKHIAPGTSAGELTTHFARCGPIDAIAAPPDVSIALIRFSNPDNAHVAFQKLAYKKIKGTPLFLEWAPVGSLADDEDAAAMGRNNSNQQQQQEEEDDGATGGAARTTHTVYITNLPFGVSEEAFRAFLADSVSKLASKPELIQKLSLIENKGRAYITVADAAIESLLLTKLDGKNFQGRTLGAQISKSVAPTKKAAEQQELQLQQGNNKSATDQQQNDGGKDATTSSSTSAASLCPPGRDPLKLIVKNLPFEATEADLRQLFAAFSEIKSVRVPKRVQRFNQHHTNNHRGFGFVEFLTAEEAVKAKLALGSTHLYGRHLVLDFADKGPASSGLDM